LASSATDRERTTQERRLRKIVDQRQKLLDAHYADAIPLDLLKSEQTRIAAEVAAIEGRLAEVAADFQKAETNLQRALTRAGDCEAAYREATPTIRRQFNLAFFKRLLIDEDCTVTGELAEPFDLLLSEELRQAAIAQASYELQDAVDEAQRRKATEGEGNEQRPQEPERVLVGAETTPTRALGGGLSPNILVRMRGLEPPPSYLDTDLTVHKERRCVRGRPDGPLCAGLRTKWTDRTI